MSEERLDYISLESDNRGYRLVFQFTGGGVAHHFARGQTYNQVISKLTVLQRMIERDVAERDETAVTDD